MNLIVNGGKKLCGSVNIFGAKNAFLPLLAAACVTEKDVMIDNIPLLEDTSEKIELLEKNGAIVSHDGIRQIRINTKDISYIIDEHSRIRTSILFTGVFLGRFGQCQIPYPKGDKIGLRNTDFHIDALTKMGAEFEFFENFFKAKTKKLQGIEYTLAFPSNGATHALILAASLAHGTMIINNASIEPETVSLCHFLQSLGVVFFNIGRSRLIIVGSGGKLYNSKKSMLFSVIPDRLQAGAYLAAGVITNGDVTVYGENFLLTLGAFLNCLTSMGVEVIAGKNYIRCISQNKNILEKHEILADIFPALATDLQPVLVPLLCCKSRRAVLQDLIFDGRFKYTHELEKMGAKIDQIDNHTIKIMHINSFKPHERLVAHDIRGGGSVLLAALNAKGRSKILNSYQICRGYDNLIHNLSALGADIDIEETEIYASI